MTTSQLQSIFDLVFHVHVEREGNSPLIHQVGDRLCFARRRRFGTVHNGSRLIHLCMSIRRNNSRRRILPRVGPGGNQLRPCAARPRSLGSRTGGQSVPARPLDQ